MGLFGPKHQILELLQIPRERPVLQNLINTARAARRKSTIIAWASGLIVLVALCVLISAFRSAMPNTPKYKVLLPMVGKGTTAQVDQRPTPLVINDSNSHL